MKKIILMLSLIGLAWGAQAQQLDKYEEMEGVDGVFVTQHMFELLSKIDVDADGPDDESYESLIKSLTGMKVLTTLKSDIGVDMENDAKAYITAEKLEELMRVHKDGKNLKFYSKPGSADNKVSELFMVMTQKEDAAKRYVVLSLTGDIDLDEIGKVSADFKEVPGAKELQNVKAK